LEMLGLGFVHGESPVDRLTDELYEIRSKWDKVEICRVAASFNKVFNVHSSTFGASIGRPLRGRPLKPRYNLVLK
ncbi:hypothetical protein, partial [Marinibactrum halimedae]|uniref:hypothetical protein n=1 Tax=Marinibactrum halimedae TaxID=1444977 RepID=UPI001E3C6784